MKTPLRNISGEYCGEARDLGLGASCAYAGRWFCAVRILFVFTSYVVGEIKQLVFASPAGRFFRSCERNQMCACARASGGSPPPMYPCCCYQPTTNVHSSELVSGAKGTVLGQPNRPFLMVRIVCSSRRAQFQRTRGEIVPAISDAFAGFSSMRYANDNIVGNGLDRSERHNIADAPR